jgi:hypothetical protein
MIGTADLAAQLGKLSALGTTPNWSELEALAGSLTREEFQKVWQELYSEANALPPPFEITEEALLVPTGQDAKPKLKLPFARWASPALRWRAPGDVQAICRHGTAARC